VSALPSLTPPAEARGGGGAHESGDLVVLIIDKQPSPSGGQVNTHRHSLMLSAT
jgi:hypothetical protein